MSVIYLIFRPSFVTLNQRPKLNGVLSTAQLIASLSLFGSEVVSYRQIPKKIGISIPIKIIKKGIYFWKFTLENIGLFLIRSDSIMN